MANVAHSYQITLFGRCHCFPRGVARGLPKKAFEESKIACWASGAPWGSQAAPWRPVLYSSCCISGLGSFLGSFFVAFRVSGMYLGIFFGLLQSFPIPDGIFVSKIQVNLKMCFQIEVSAFLFFFSSFQYVKRHGRPNFPDVVSSCYRAGNWEWV